MPAKKMQILLWTTLNCKRLQKTSKDYKRLQTTMRYCKKSFWTKKIANDYTRPITTKKVTKDCKFFLKTSEDF